MVDAAGQTPRILLAQPSAMSLFIQMSFNGTPLATGTGFVVQAPRGPVLITNLHNVTGLNRDTGQPLSPTGGVPNEIRILHNIRTRLGPGDRSERRFTMSTARRNGVNTRPSEKERTW